MNTEVTELILHRKQLQPTKHFDLAGQGLTGRLGRLSGNVIGWLNIYNFQQFLYDFC